MNKTRFFSQETNLVFNGTTAQTFNTSTSSTSAYRYNGVVTTAVSTSTTSSSTITLAAANSLIQPGQTVMNSEIVVGTVASVSGTTVTLTANALSTVTNALLYYVTPTVRNLTVNNTLGLNIRTNLNVSGTLNLTAGILSIDSSFTLRITSGNDIAGAPFNSTKYISTNSYFGKDAYGILRIDNINAAKLFPVGTQLSGYLPATLTPSNASSFSVAVLDSVSVNGARSGDRVANISDAVNATWKIDRASGTGSATVAFGWDNSLEGSGFAAAGNGIGISVYDGTTYQPASGTADNTANTANLSVSTFGSNLAFTVLKSGVVTLPTNLLNFSARLSNKNVYLNWATTQEINMKGYFVERSNDGVTFVNVGFVFANNNRASNLYTLTDVNTKTGNNYYRIKMVNTDGSFTLSNTLVINIGAAFSNGLTFFPNPVKNVVTITHDTAGENSSVNIYTIEGKLIYQKPISKGSIQTSMDLSFLQSGKYVLSYKNGKDSKSSLFIK